MKTTKIGAIVLAAGKGKRMNSKKINKVVLPLANKPMILHAVELLERLGVYPIVIVVGFAKKSVMEILGEKVYFAQQHKRLGTAHAARKGLAVIGKMGVSDVLIIQGDDSAFYTKETIDKLIAHHLKSNAAFTFLTINTRNPFALGRVVRDSSGKLVKIVEEKDATESEKQISEINPACYIFKVSFLEKYLKKVAKSPVTGEYYLTSLIDMAIHAGERVETMRAGEIPWRGVNSPDELAAAESLYLQLKEVR